MTTTQSGRTGVEVRLEELVRTYGSVKPWTAST